MVQLIKKGGLRERANRSLSYKGSENTEATLKPNRYVQPQKNEQVPSPAPSSISASDETAPNSYNMENASYHNQMANIRNNPPEITSI